MNYIVHGRHDTKVDVPAITTDGRKITGQMPAVIVELVPVDPWGKTVTHIALTPDEESRAEADELFQEGNEVSLDFSLVSEKE